MDASLFPGRRKSTIWDTIWPTIWPTILAYNLADHLADQLAHHLALLQFWIIGPTIWSTIWPTIPHCFEPVCGAGQGGQGFNEKL